MWKPLEISGAGSEGGTVIADEEYNGACRITLEKCEKYYAITCGVYGAMVHTAFAGADNYRSVYDEMKSELQRFIDTDTTASEELEFYDRFCSRY